MQSDMPIPSLENIKARALDIRASAARLGDEPAVRQLDRLLDNAPHARLCWQLGTLHIDSPSGGHYQVTRAGCSCLNGRKGQRACWHWACFNLLLDLLDTEAESADQVADLCALFTERLAETARLIDGWRRQQRAAFAR